MALSGLNLRSLTLFVPHNTVWLYFQRKTIVKNLKLLLVSKIKHSVLKWIWISYLARFVDSKQHIHRITHQSRGMAFSHHRITFEKDRLTEEGLTIDSVDEFSGLGAFWQPSSHYVKKTCIKSGGMAPPSWWMRRSFDFKFPSWFAERGFVLLNFHDLKYYMLGKLNSKCYFGRNRPL